MLRDQSLLPSKSNPTSSPLPYRKNTFLPSATGEGVAGLLFRKLRELVPACFCHICLPVWASKHIATNSFDRPTIELKKTLPFEMTGVAELGPGRGNTQ